MARELLEGLSLICESDKGDDVFDEGLEFPFIEDEPMEDALVVLLEVRFLFSNFLGVYGSFSDGRIMTFPLSSLLEKLGSVRLFCPAAG